MINNELNILFLIERTKLNKQNRCLIKCRLTFNCKRKSFSTGFFINPDYWKSNLQIAKSSKTENNHINAELGLIKQELNRAFLFLQVNSNTFDVEDTNEEKTILKLFN